MSNISLLSIAGSVASFVIIVVLTRQRKIREQYALIWLAMGCLILVFSVFRSLLDPIARFLGIYYAPSLLIILIVFFGMVLGIHFTIVLSKLTENQTKLIQDIGWVKHRLDQLEKSGGAEDTSKQAVPGPEGPA
jgi:hypothetical protein